MIGIALRSLRARPAAMLVVLLVGCLAPLLLTAAGTLLATAVTLSAPPDRFTAPVVVAGPAGFALPDQEHQTVAYSEGSVVPSGLAAKLTGTDGVDHVETIGTAVVRWRSESGPRAGRAPTSSPTGSTTRSATTRRC